MMISFPDVIFSLCAALLVASGGVARAFFRPACRIALQFGRCNKTQDGMADRFAAATFLSAVMAAGYASVVMFRTVTHAWTVSQRPWLALAVLGIVACGLLSFYLAMTAWYVVAQSPKATRHFETMWAGVLILVALLAAPIGHYARAEILGSTTAKCPCATAAAMRANP